MTGRACAMWFAVVALATLVSGCVTAGQNGTGPVAVDTAAAARAVSAYRATQGLGAVTPSASLNAVAARQSRAMARRGRLGHDLDGSFPKRLKAGGYAWSVAVENVGAGHDSFEAALASWQRSPGHRRNLLAPGVTQIGVAAARSPDRYRIYWTLILASPAAGAGASGE